MFGGESYKCRFWSVYVEFLYTNKEILPWSRFSKVSRNAIHPLLSFSMVFSVITFSQNYFTYTKQVVRKVLFSPYLIGSTPLSPIKLTLSKKTNFCDGKTFSLIRLISGIAQLFSHRSAHFIVSVHIPFIFAINMGDIIIYIP